ncbi:MAG: long-chain fatty acid--CoA ligase, partial [Deltaproteobacteria bacterium]|nr:long-chain fatty acid--CoA ligase [Deltaproteobacteria bacterium]
EHSESKVVIVENKSQLKKIEEVKKNLPALQKIISFEKISADILYFKKLTQTGDFDSVYFKKRVHSIPFDQLATIVYTSGTTGQPKGVMLTHQNLSSEVDALQQYFKFDSSQESLIFLPLAHILARAVQFVQLSVGFVQFYAESIDKLIENIKEVKPHFMACVPRIFEKIYSKIMHDVESSSLIKKGLFHWAVNVGTQISRSKQLRKDPAITDVLQNYVAQLLVFSKLQERLGGRIQFFISGGAPLSKEIAEFFHAANILILEGYGLTETCAAVNCNRPNAYQFGSVGKIVSHIEEKIAPDGEILVKGGHVFKGYYKNEEATREAFTADGFFKTGDIGEFDEEGFLKITDRKKDIIVTAAGKNIAPQYIENILKTDPLISQVMVHGDRRKFLSALITLNPEEVKALSKSLQVDASDYSNFVKNKKIIEYVHKKIEDKNRQLASYESIKKFAILDIDFTVEGGELTPTLKVKRKLLTERYKGLLDSFYQDHS